MQVSPAEATDVDHFSDERLEAAGGVRQWVACICHSVVHRHKDSGKVLVVANTLQSQLNRERNHVSRDLFCSAVPSLLLSCEAFILPPQCQASSKQPLPGNSLAQQVSHLRHIRLLQVMCLLGQVLSAGLMSCHVFDLNNFCYETTFRLQMATCGILPIHAHSGCKSRFTSGQLSESCTPCCLPVQRLVQTNTLTLVFS